MSRYFAASSAVGGGASALAQDEDEDDFMSDKFLAAASNEDSKRQKTYSQMRKEAVRKAEDNGRIKSRAEREKEAREEGLKRSLIFDHNATAAAGPSSRSGSSTPALEGDKGSSTSAQTGSKGSSKALDMMLKMGFKPGEALGKRARAPGIDASGSNGHTGAAGHNNTLDDSGSEDSDDDGFIPLNAGLGSRKGKAASRATQQAADAPKAKLDDRRVDPIEIQMRAGRAGLGVEEAKRRRLHDLASKSDNRAKLSVDDYRSRARDDHDERRALNKLVAARKTMQELDERSGIMSNYLWLDPHEEYARMRAENWGGARFGPKGRLGDFGAVDEADEDAYGFGDDQNRNNTLREGQIDIALEGEEAFESDEIVKMDEQKDEFLQLDARARLAKTTAYLRDKYHYCLWCGAQYASRQELEQECPGEDEEDH